MTGHREHPCPDGLRLDVASNIVPRISARTFGVGRHLTPAGRKAFLGPYTDRAKRRTLHYQLTTHGL